MTQWSKRWMCFVFADGSLAVTEHVIVIEWKMTVWDGWYA